jgi:hypothetical protein
LTGNNSPNGMVKTMRGNSIFALFLLVLGVAILFHQFVNWGIWFQIHDVHHETFALICFSIAAGIYIGKTSEK